MAGTGVDRTVRALVLTAPGKGLELREVPAPRPGAGEALVRVRACGLCHTDLHYLDHGVATAKPPPLVLGHEISGRVVSVGDGAHGPPPDTDVLVPALLPCGRCPYCLTGRANLCPEARMPGNHFDGGFAELLVVPAKDLVPLPSEVDPVVGCVIADALTTPYHAVVERAAVRAGERVAVIGCGGVGINVVQVAAAAGAEVVAIDLSEAKLDAARALGAVDTIRVGGGEDPVREVRRRLGDGVDAAFEVVGRPETIALGFAALRRGGRLCLVGYSSQPAVLPAHRAMFYEYTVLGSLGCPPATYPRVVDLVRRGKLQLGPIVTRKLPLDRFEEALTALRSGDGFRSVLLP